MGRTSSWFQKFVIPKGKYELINTRAASDLVFIPGFYGACPTKPGALSTRFRVKVVGSRRGNGDVLGLSGNLYM
jgi:hypothetical protein